MLREFMRAFCPRATASMTRAVAALATALMFAALPACGIKGPLKPAPAAPAPTTSAPQNPGDIIPPKPTDQPAVTAPPPIPPIVKP